MAEADGEPRVLGQVQSLRPPSSPSVYIDGPTPFLPPSVVASLWLLGSIHAPRLVRPEIYVALDRLLTTGDRWRGVGDRPWVGPPPPVPPSKVREQVPHGEEPAVRLEPPLAADPRRQAPPSLVWRLPPDVFLHGEVGVLEFPSSGTWRPGRELVNGILLRPKDAHTFRRGSQPDPAQNGPTSRLALKRRWIEDGRHGRHRGDERWLESRQSSVWSESRPFATVCLHRWPFSLGLVGLFKPFWNLLLN